MKKINKMTLLSSILSLILLFNGCGNSASPDSIEENTGSADVSAPSTEKDTVPEQTIQCRLPLQSQYTQAEQVGPYGKLSLSIPNGWHYELYPMDSEELLNGLYGIRFYPDGVTEGCIELAYIDSFGVCGTGLYEEAATIAGNPAMIGIYDNHTYWDFIFFQEDYTGIVALTYHVEDWWDSYGAQVMDILNTLTFDTSAKESFAFIDTP